MVTLVRVETGTQTTGHRDTEMTSRVKAGDTEMMEMVITVVTVTIIVTTQGGEKDTVDRGGIEIRDIHPLAGQEAGVVTGSGMNTRTTQAMGTMGERRTSGTDISKRT